MKQILSLLLSALLAATAAAAQGPAAVLTFKAAQPGQRTLDSGSDGGNPFASAVVRSFIAPDRLGNLPQRIKALTGALSNGFQDADVPADAEPATLPIMTFGDGDRVALVLVYSSYGGGSGLDSLPGAAIDARRIGDTFKGAGYATEVLIDPAPQSLPRILASFAERSARADAAIVYTTGHGVEVDGIGYLLPNDYPIGQGVAALPGRALPLQSIAASLKAKSANLFFYGGCRDDPFAR